MPIPRGFGLCVHQELETKGNVHTLMPHASWVDIDDATVVSGTTIAQLRAIVKTWQDQSYHVNIRLAGVSWGNSMIGHARDVIVGCRPNSITGPANEPNRPDAGGRMSGAAAATLAIAIRTHSFRNIGFPCSFGGCELDWYQSGGAQSDHDDSAIWWADFMAGNGHLAYEFKTIHGYGANVGAPSAFENPSSRVARVRDFHLTYPAIPTVCSENCFRSAEVTYLKGSNTAALAADLHEEERAGIMAIPGVVAYAHYHSPYVVDTTDISILNAGDARSSFGTELHNRLTAAGIVGVGG